MLLSSLNTGSTDLRDTEVQQPNTTETLSLVISSRAFSAKSGQFDAGSTTTASSLRPSTPPFLFCSSISISMTSFRVVSLIAIVPDRECSTPTLIGAPCANALPAAPASRPAATMPVLRIDPNFIPLSFLSTEYPRQLPQERKPCQTPARIRYNRQWAISTTAPAAITTPPSARTRGRPQPCARAS